MKCPNCGRENPPGIRFCVFCGTALPTEEVKTPVTPARPVPSTAVSAPVAREALTPVFRPFGVVLITLFQSFTGLVWLLFGLFLYYLQLFSSISVATALRSVEEFTGSLEGLFPGEVTFGITGATVVISILIAFLTLLSLVLGLLSIAGSIGLWLLTGWGRKVTFYVQALTVAMYLIILFSSALSRTIRASGLLPALLLWPFVCIIISVLIILYLSGPGLDRWFREA